MMLRMGEITPVGIDALCPTAMGPGQPGTSKQPIQQVNNNRVISNAEEGEVQAAQYLQSNPYLENLILKMVKDGIAQETCRLSQGKEQGRLQIAQVADNTERMTTPKRGGFKSKPRNVTKSPSDTTIYAPALQKKSSTR